MGDQTILKSSSTQLPGAPTCWQPAASNKASSKACRAASACPLSVSKRASASPQKAPSTQCRWESAPAPISPSSSSSD